MVVSDSVLLLTGSPDALQHLVQKDVMLGINFSEWKEVFVLNSSSPSRCESKETQDLTSEHLGC